MTITRAYFVCCADCGTTADVTPSATPTRALERAAAKGYRRFKVQRERRSRYRSGTVRREVIEEFCERCARKIENVRVEVKPKGVSS